jgi:nucleoside-diphosphate-sugar epimerase
MSNIWAVTGGSGFIGRHLIARLQEEGIACRALVRGGSAGGAEMIRGDIRDRDAVVRLVSGAGVVVHLAGYVHRVVRTRREREECRSVNAGGTAAVVDAVIGSAPDAFLIHVSTASVYAPSDEPLTETAPTIPQNAYGASKLEAEQLVIDAARELHAAIIRPAMVFGDGAPGNLAHLTSMIRRGFLIEIGRGENRKSILPVGTLVDAILALALNRDAADGEIFNVTGGEPMTMRLIADAIASAVGRAPRRIAMPRAPLFIAGRLLDALLAVVPLPVPKLSQMVESYGSTVVLDDAKLRVRIGFTPSADVRAALAAASVATS